MLKDRLMLPNLRDPFSCPFYKKFTAENVRKEVDVLGAGGTPADLSPDNIRKLYYESEPVVTSDNCIKRLVIYQKFLLWFEEIRPPGSADFSPGSPPKVGTHFTLDYKVCSEEIPTVLGYANLSGFYVESRDLIQPANQYLTMTNTLFLSKSSAVDPGYNHLPSVDLSMIGDSAPQSTVQNPQLRYFKIYPHQRSLVSETIFFDRAEQMNKWRGLLSEAPVFFGDFTQRYRVKEKTTKEGSNQIWHVEDNLTKERLVAKVQPVIDPSDIREVRNLSARVFREANLLLRLKPAHVTSAFKELCFTGKAFIIVEESMQALRFSNWFSEEWRSEVGARVSPSQVHNLLTDLALVVLTFHSFNIAHGSISKEVLYVKTSANEDQSSMEPTLMSPNNKSSEMQRVGEAKDSSYNVFKTQKTANFCHRPNPLKRESLGPLPKERVVLPTVIMTAAQRRRFCLIGLGTALSFDSSSAMRPSIKGGHQLVPPSFGISPRKSASPSPRTPGYLRETSPETDVFDLGVIMFEILFGIDIIHATQHTFGIESEFVSLLLKNPGQVMSIKEPIYDVDDRVLHLVGRMLQPDKLNRPSMHECYEILSQVCHYPVQIKSPGTRKAERKFSAFHSKLSMESILVGIENLAFMSARADGSLHPSDHMSCFSPTRSPLGRAPQVSNFAKKASIQISPRTPEAESHQRFSSPKLVLRPADRSPSLAPKLKGTEYLPIKVIPFYEKQAFPPKGKSDTLARPVLQKRGTSSPRVHETSIDMGTNRSRKLVLNVIRSESPNRSTSNDSRRVCFLAREMFKTENKLPPKLLRVIGNSSILASHSIMEFTARRSAVQAGKNSKIGEISARSITKELDRPFTTPRKRRLITSNAVGADSQTISEGDGIIQNTTIVKLGYKDAGAIQLPKGNHA